MTRPRSFEASADSGAAGTYPTLCCRCHRLVMLSLEDAVLAEARVIVGDLTVVFCGDCIRQAALRMVDGAWPHRS